MLGRFTSRKGVLWSLRNTKKVRWRKIRKLWYVIIWRRIWTQSKGSELPPKCPITKSHSQSKRTRKTIRRMGRYSNSQRHKGTPLSQNLRPSTQSQMRQSRERNGATKLLCTPVFTMLLRDQDKYQLSKMKKPLINGPAISPIFKNLPKKLDSWTILLSLTRRGSKILTRLQSLTRNIEGTSVMVLTRSLSVTLAKHFFHRSNSWSTMTLTRRKKKQWQVLDTDLSIWENRPLGLTYTKILKVVKLVQ